MSSQKQDKHPYQYDVIVIGSGPGGEGAAMRAVKAGKRVAMVDDFPELGGNCTHKGTIPSKALRHAVQQMMGTRRVRDMSYQGLRQAAQRVVRRQVETRTRFYDRNRVDTLLGWARFVDAHTIDVVSANGRRAGLYSAAYFIIATGARPYHPDNVDFSHPRIMDSDTVLNLQYDPNAILIYGAGVIGCEYASIFKGLQKKVSLVNTRDRLLSFLDDEIIDALAYHMRHEGIMLYHNEDYHRVEADDYGVTLHLKSNKQIHADVLLWAQGRTGNSANIGLAELGIETDQRGSIKVDPCYQTNQPHIYAVGDVIGFPSLASAAYDQGRSAAAHIIDDQAAQLGRIEKVPTGIYTIPEISSVGATERELTEMRVPYEVGHAFFRHLARAQITDNTTGMLKLLFHRESLQLLGVHCFGAQASEIVHIGQAIMNQPGQGNDITYFVNTTFNYPTMAEAYRVAALNGLNRLKRPTEVQHEAS